MNANAIEATGPVADRRAGVPDWRTILAWLAGTAVPGEAPRRSAAVGEAPDWRAILTHAWWHGLASVLYQLGTDAGFESMPEWAVGELRASFHCNAMHNVQIARELARLVTIARAHRVSPIAFKGVMLAMLAYGELAMRPAGDIDLLIEQREYGEFSAILRSLGYRSHWPSAMPPKFRGNSEEFLAADRRTMVDVHWRMVPSELGFRAEATTLRHRAISLELDGTAVLSLSVEDLLMFLSVHGAKHGWARLGWIFDVGGLVRRHPQLDWDALAARSSELRIRRRLLLALYLAHRITGVDFPDRFMAAAEQDRVVRRIAGRVLARSMNGVGFRTGLFRDWVVPTLAMEGSTDRLRYLAVRAMRPGFDDWRLLRTHRPWYPLYFGLRPVRLMLEHAPRLVRNVTPRAMDWLDDTQSPQH